MTRTITRLRDGWKFTRTPNEAPLTPGCDDSGWEEVQVPHDWAIAGPFDKKHDMVTKVPKGQADIEKGTVHITGRSGGLPHMGEGWYRKEIDIETSSKGRVFRLECDGIMSHSKIYCNGEFVGGWPYGYTSFAFDLTPFVKPGERNLIAVHVNNPASSSRWYPGAGIYRVSLEISTLPDGVALTDPDKEELPNVEVRDGQSKKVIFPLGEGTISTVSTYERVGVLFIAGLKLGFKLFSITHQTHTMPGFRQGFGKLLSTLGLPTGG